MKTKGTLGVMLLLGLLSSRDALAFYNPSTGRWLNRDPITERGGQNLYSFVNNSPPQTIDSVGQYPTTSFYICWPKCGDKTYNPRVQCCCDGKVIYDAKVETGVVKHKWSENPQGPGKYHVWVTWEGGSADSNGDSVLMDPGSQKVETPAFAMPPPSTPTPIKRSPCEYDFKKLSDCLTRMANELKLRGEPGGLCDVFANRLSDDCKKESKGCTAPPGG